MAASSHTILFFTNVGGHDTGKANSEEQMGVTSRGGTLRALISQASLIDSSQPKLGSTALGTSNLMVRSGLPGTGSGTRFAPGDSRSRGGGNNTRGEGVSNLPLVVFVLAVEIKNAIKPKKNDQRNKLHSGRTLK
eukprot:1954979-Amphidinium_carterae.1